MAVDYMPERVTGLTLRYWLLWQWTGDRESWRLGRRMWTSTDLFEDALKVCAISALMSGLNLNWPNNLDTSRTLNGSLNTITANLNT